jgi:hypothetical protein
MKSIESLESLVSEEFGSRSGLFDSTDSIDFSVVKELYV